MHIPVADLDTSPSKAVLASLGDFGFACALNEENIRVDFCMIEDFFKKNIELKKPFLQNEHFLILRKIYENALENGIVKGYLFALGKSRRSQCMTYTEIKKTSNIDPYIILTCIADLEKHYFIMNVTKGLHQEDSYAITMLGLKYMELLSGQK